MNPRLRLALALATLVTGLANLALLLRAGDDRPRPLIYLLINIVGVSWTFVGAGLVAWTRRPENRTGALMIAVGLPQLCPGRAALQRCDPGSPHRPCSCSSTSCCGDCLKASSPTCSPSSRTAAPPPGHNGCSSSPTTPPRCPWPWLSCCWCTRTGSAAPGCPDDPLGIGIRHPNGDWALDGLPQSLAVRGAARCCCGSWRRDGAGRPGRADAASPRSCWSAWCWWSSTWSAKRSSRSCPARHWFRTGWTWWSSPP